MLTGRNGILLPTLREVANELGVSVGQLVDPPDEDSVTRGGNKRQRAIAETGGSYGSGDRSPRGRHPVEIVEVALAAGYDETPVGVLWFPEDWLQSQSIDPVQSNIVGVRGPSMEPTLPDGCSILVDRQRREPHEGRIFIVRTEDGVLTRRLGLDERGRWEMLSDNPDWEPALLTYGSEIIGEVRWVARTL